MPLPVSLAGMWVPPPKSKVYNLRLRLQGWAHMPLVFRAAATPFSPLCASSTMVLNKIPLFVEYWLKSLWRFGTANSLHGFPEH